ncbi:MAG: TM0106 family RecB-like putative nuclease [Microbacteriaceae bacterium]|nr:TM0106 family RecB-like putative nuclease [Microbacteriaceae bacterium]
MYLLDSTVITSASDLSTASGCEFAFARKLDVLLGRIPAATTEPDAMLQRTATLGDAHELRVLQSYRERFGAGVVEIDRPNLRDAAAIEAALALSRDAFASGADVVFQATFFDGSFIGFADFIVREDTPDGIRYRVQDTKLARSAKVSALLQLAAYAEQLEKIGIIPADTVELLLGNGVVSEHRLRDILPVYRKRRARLADLVAGRQADSMATAWGDERYLACGRCDTCEEQVQSTRDVLLVAGLRVTQRAKLRAENVTTIDQLAERSSPVPGIAGATLAALQQQAALQLAPHDPISDAPRWQVAERTAFAALPEPDDGDIFFDFEGDPLHHEGSTWGLDYLFGLVEPDGTFRPFWAHDLAAERQTLIDFLDFVVKRRARHPALHIYHYASYERSHLLSLAARHGVGEEIIDDLLRANVLVDLYPIVKRGLRIGSRSYSLKKLEPLYMGNEQRSGVANAADSIAEYVHYRELIEAGESDAAARVLADIASYNAYDCLSTLRLRDWLRQIAPQTETETETAAFGAAAVLPELPIAAALREPDPVYLELMAVLEHIPPGQRTADDNALALASAAIDYHRREAKTFWWGHFSRLANPLPEWADTRDVLVIDQVSVEQDWFREGRQSTDRRVLRVSGTVAPGSSIKKESNPFLVYDLPAPPIDVKVAPGSRLAHNRSEIVEVLSPTEFLITERLSKGAEQFDDLPVALAPSSPPDPGTQVGAISEWGRAVLTALPAMLPDAALDILRRVPPRVVGKGGIALGLDPVHGGDTAAALRNTLLKLDRSYLAVQGPPGTGKTFTGSRLIVDLVQNHGWRVGVVAQSHAAVENMLAGIVKAGLDPVLVGKKPRGGDEQVKVPWRGPADGKFGSFSAPGFVLGGTAWVFSNANSVPRDALDLLVVDEAGQFSLASTIACSVAATRLLLLGDPQQLPQVSQGSHPEPIDVSALGWLSKGHDVLPPEFGYFLATSWRMHAAVCAPVSELSYEGKLLSHASERSLAGIEPGLHPRPTPHWGNSTFSPEEADAVVAIVGEVLGKPWVSAGTTRPLEQSNIIVVAPYNAQVELLRERLTTSGFADIPVGTVDKFQGREAAVAILSVTASSAEDAPRGLEFILLANRLNVGISRAQWAAYLVYSPTILENLPTSAAGLAQLSAFIRLVETPPLERKRMLD